MTISMQSRWGLGRAGLVAAALLVSGAALQAQEAAAIAEKATQALNESQRLFGLGQYQDAVVAAQTALRLQPENAAAYNNLAVGYAGLGNWNEAVKAIRTALRLQPGFHLAVNNLAWFLKAKPSATSLAEVAQDTASWLDLSLGYYQDKRFAESIDAARELLKLEPGNALAYNNIAAAYASRGMWDEAIQAAQAAILLDPGLQLARNNLAWAEAAKLNAGARGKQ